jgi:iron(II)-dependent oxidoreductase
MFVESVSNMIKIPFKLNPGLILMMILCVWVASGCSPATPELIPVTLEPVPSQSPTLLQASTEFPTLTPFHPTATFTVITASLMSTPVVDTPLVTVTKSPNIYLPPALPPDACMQANIPENACLGVSRNADWEPLIREIRGVEMVLVPAGCFPMGNSMGVEKEQPVHLVCIPAPFWMDLTEVTVAQYTDFMNASRSQPDDILVWTNASGQDFIQVVQEGARWVPAPGDATRPLEAVPYAKAVEYCIWRGARLLTEAEWEFAARGPEGWLYPWGNDFDPEKVVRTYDKVPPAGSKPQGASWVGALDQSSSLYEWVSTIFRPYPYDPLDGREAGLAQDDTSPRVLRGGAWYHTDTMYDNVTATGRISLPPWYVSWPMGIRCARSLVEPTTMP